MIETMQQLPMLQGLTTEEFNDILMHISLDFRSFEAGETIVHQGDTCSRLIFIIDGEYEAEYRNAENSFSVTQVSQDTPVLIEPHNLFSVRRKYERSYTFTTHGATFSIAKEVFTGRLLNNPIVRSNLINMLSNQTSKLRTQAYFDLPTDIGQRMAAFISSFTTDGKGKVRVNIAMDTLADLTDETRLNVSKVLNEWDDKGLIELHRLWFDVADLERLKASTNPSKGGEKD